jgi:uncharacterized Tic20 family protein
MTDSPEGERIPAQDSSSPDLPPAPPPPRVPGWQPGDAAPPFDVQQERFWATIAHLSALAVVALIPNFIGPLVVYLAYRERGEFVRDQAAESLNFQITTAIAGFVSILLIPAAGIGIPLFLVVLIGWLILTVLAGIAANGGRRYRYPLNLRLIK